MLNMSEFLKGREVKANTLSNYVTRHPELFEGHVKREGKNTFFDDEAVRILEEKYPIAKPVVIVNGLSQEEERELRKRLQQSQELLLAMQNELTNTKLQLAEKETLSLRIEMKDEKIEQLSREVDELKTTNQELKEAIEKDRKRGLIQRIFNR